LTPLSTPGLKSGRWRTSCPRGTESRGPLVCRR
jgi:hypothetical protein